MGHVKVTAGTLNDVENQILAWLEQDEDREYSCIPLNLSKYVMAKSDPKLAAAINQADIVIADGIAIAWLAKRMGWRDIHRITGIDLAESLLLACSSRNHSIFMLGAKPSVLEQACSNLRDRFGKDIITAARDGYFKAEEVTSVVDDIANHKPDILFLGLGLPQKEYFVHDHLHATKARLCLTVGGAFDIWAGVKKRAPALVQSMGLEFLYRSFYDISRAGLIARYGLTFLKDYAFPPTNRGL